MVVKGENKMNNTDKFLGRFNCTLNNSFEENDAVAILKKDTTNQLSKLFQKEAAPKKDENEYSWDSELPENAGPVISSDGKSVKVLKEPRHTAVFGSTGSGKSRACIMPGIIASAKQGDNLVIGDCKAELFNRMSGHLALMGYDVKVLNFADPCRSNCFSLFKPAFDLIKKNAKNDVAQGKVLLMHIAKTVCPVTSDKDPSWEITAANLLYALSFIRIMEADSCEEVTFKSILDLKNTLLNNESEISGHMAGLNGQTDIESAIEVLTMDAKSTQSCYVVIMEQAILKFAFNDVLQTVLSKDEVSVESFIAKKTALFIIFPDENTTYNPLVASVVKMIYEGLIRTARFLPGNRLDRRVHFVLDEFAQMPLVDFASAISAARSRNIVFTLVIQSYSQLINRFGTETADTILNNCNVWVYLGGSDIDIIDRISRFSIDLKREDVMFLDREEGEAVVREANKPPYLTTLVDISEYGEGWNVDSIELPTTPEYETATASVEKKDEIEFVFSESDEYENAEGKAEPKRSITDLLESLHKTYRFSNLYQLDEIINYSKILDGLTQKELSDVMKFICYDPSLEAYALGENSRSGFEMSGFQSTADAMIDFLTAFAPMDKDYRMFDLMLFNDREWARLKKVMTEEGWSEEEAESMRAALMERCAKAVKPDFPKGYIGVCKKDRTFETIVCDRFMAKYGKTPRFDVDILRDLAYMLRYDYDEDGFMNLLFRYAETGQIDFTPRPGFAPVPELLKARISSLMDSLFKFE